MNDTFLCGADAKVDAKERTVEIMLEDGRRFLCSLAETSQRLRLADPSLLRDWEWIGPKAGMHWPAVDEDLSIEYLINHESTRSYISEATPALTLIP